MWGAVGVRAAADLGELEGVVDLLLGLGRVLALDHDREVQLRRALRDRDHVDARLGQGGEDARHDAGRVRHPGTDHGQGGHARPDLDAVDLTAADLVGEGLEEGGLGAARRSPAAP